MDLGKNDIRFLPENFGELTNLRHLDLYNNKLEHLPLSFGNLTKLRYLDLKGNPLTPALQKIVGPCLSSKDCADAAKRVIPFMQNLEIEVRAEQKKKHEEDQRLMEEEEAKRLEEEKAAKKRQAKKDKQYRDKLKKRESEMQRKSEESIESLESEEFTENGETTQKVDEISPTVPQSRGFLFRFIKFTVLFTIFLAILSLLTMRFLPRQSDLLLDLLPIQQKMAVKGFYDNVNLLIKNYFEKIPNLYKIK